MKGASRDLIIGCVYIPPQSPYEIFVDHLATISFIREKHQASDLLIVGDFNLPSSSPRADCEKLLYDCYSLLNCTQRNHILNAHNSALDLCFSDIDISPEHSLALVPEDTYHPALDITLNFQPGLVPIYSSTYSFKKANYAELNTFYLRTNWIDLYKLSTIDSKLDYLYAKIFEGINQFVPAYTYKHSSYPSWFSKDLIRKIKLKKSAHALYKTRRTNYNYSCFSKLRLECKSLSSECYKNYVSNVEAKLKSDIKAFWNYVKDKNRSSSDIPSSMVWDDLSANSGPDICDLFASFFHSVYAPNNRHGAAAATYNPGPQNILLNDLTVSYDEVLKLLLSLDPRKGAGPDGLPNLFLKNCAISLCEPLTHIFGESLSGGIFPSSWKLSYITPIHKDGSKAMVTNYRPICIQSALAKLFEKLVLPQLLQSFEHVIITRQHGFTGGRSTTTNLFIYINKVLNAMDSGNCVHSIYTDFSKAFDRVDHDILMHKLSNYGVGGSALSWIHSYLTGRRLQVRVDGHLSFEYIVTSGVPQGSHLGPVLFNIFINDIGNNIISDHLLYADDLKIFRPIASMSDILILQHDIDSLGNWCLVNNLDLNINKCAAITFTRSHSPIPAKYKLKDQEIIEVDEIKDLGIIVDNKLSFSKHIDRITSKGFKTLGFILRNSKDFNNPYSVTRLFQSLVLPILEYGSVIWSPYTNASIDKVEKVQRKFCKSLAYKLSSSTHTYSTDEIYQSFRINKLSARRQVADLSFYYKVVNNIIDAPDILGCFEFAPVGTLLRRNRLLKTSNSKKNYVINGPLNRLAKSVNSFQGVIDFYGGTYSAFIDNTKKHLLV